MTNSEVRAHLRKGELAVALAEALGYSFGTDPENSNRDVWIDPPPKPEDVVAKAVKDLIETQTKAQVDALKKAQATDPRGPNWHLVADMVGNLFRVVPEKIPLNHPLREYGEVHFRGVNYRAQEITYVRSEVYTGYSVRFQFRKRPFSQLESVWLPLSCAAFQP